VLSVCVGSLLGNGLFECVWRVSVWTVYVCGVCVYVERMYVECVCMCVWMVCGCSGCRRMVYVLNMCVCV